MNKFFKSFVTEKKPMKNSRIFFLVHILFLKHIFCLKKGLEI